MDEIILISKIEESVTCNVYKSRVAALMKYKNFFSIFSAKREYNSLLNTIRKQTRGA
jgi:predicted secreted protein